VQLFLDADLLPFPVLFIMGENLGEEDCPCTRPWTRPADGFTARLPLATPAATLSPSSKEVVCLCPKHKEIHIILDNLAAHKTTLVREFLKHHPRVRFHFTPPYSSWLNQVELWFAKIERDVIAFDVETGDNAFQRAMEEMGPIPGIAFELFRVFLADVILGRALAAVQGHESLALLLVPLFAGALLYKSRAAH
jgi:hypothetical protein